MHKSMLKTATEHRLHGENWEEKWFENNTNRKKPEKNSLREMEMVHKTYINC